MSWYAKYKELLEAMGYNIAGYNTLPPHKELVQKLKDLVEKAWMYDDLCK